MTTTKPLEYWIDIRDVNRSHLGESVSWILKHNPKTRQINYDNEFLNVVEAQAYYETLDRITKLEAENAKLKKALQSKIAYLTQQRDRYIIAYNNEVETPASEIETIIKNANYELEHFSKVACDDKNA